jgi:hypothetical protein
MENIITHTFYDTFEINSISIYKFRIRLWIFVRSPFQIECHLFFKFYLLFNRRRVVMSTFIIMHFISYILVIKKFLFVSDDMVKVCYVIKDVLSVQDLNDVCMTNFLSARSVQRAQIKGSFLDVHFYISSRVPLSSGGLLFKSSCLASDLRSYWSVTSYPVFWLVESHTVTPSAYLSGRW